VLKVAQPAANHNGGGLHRARRHALHPFGDAGGNNGNGQRRTLQREILRIDVGIPEKGLGYAIPATTVVGQAGVRWGSGPPACASWRFSSSEHRRPQRTAMSVRVRRRSTMSQGGLNLGWDRVGAITTTRRLR
jgi:hypothetical protein